MIEIDARGLSCPIPVLQTKKALEKNPTEVTVLVSAKVQVENVTRMARSKNYEVKSVEEDKKEGFFKIHLARKSK
ncbi:MAG: sulfurtransferase TusA family protein [Planctomycetota bacterium]|nr:sulfurtransferase TusA family protein [Planctomycetota bacterium]